MSIVDPIFDMSKTGAGSPIGFFYFLFCMALLDFDDKLDNTSRASFTLFLFGGPAIAYVNFM